MRWYGGEELGGEKSCLDNRAVVCLLSVLFLCGRRLRVDGDSSRKDFALALMVFRTEPAQVGKWGPNVIQ